MIYIIDHNDSFTHNVIHQFSNFDDVECDNFNKIDQNKLNKAAVIVFSPGPGSPKNYPITSALVSFFWSILLKLSHSTLSKFEN